MKLPRLSMVHALFAALVIGGSFAAYEGASSSAAAAAPHPESAPAPSEPPKPHLSEGAEVDAAGTVEGEALEVLDVPQYTYARLGEKGSEGTWTAFPSTHIEVGQRLRLREATLMTDFTSKVLGRTFGTIWFGNLDDGAMAGGNPHAGRDGSLAPTAMGSGDDPHATAVHMHPVDRAPGPNGKTVAEVISGRSALAGKTVRIRAIVVKSTTGVLGHAYLHVRDGSGDEAAHTNDLSVTTDATPAVGDTVLIEGTLTLDVDIGSGYRFPTLLSDAKIVLP